MKVAILMKGGISSAAGSFRHKVEHSRDANKHLDYNDYINYTACYNSIKKHIIDANPTCSFDFYLQSWHPDLSEKLNNLYSPIASVHEDNAKYTDIIKRKARYAGDENRYFSQASFALSIKRVTELFKESSKEKYDMIIFYRYDLLLWKNMVLLNYSNIQDGVIYNNYYDKGDFHFIMSHDKAIKFGLNLFDSISDKIKPKDHKLVNDFVNIYFNHSLKSDNIVPGALHGGCQEVIRKLKEVSNIPFEDYGLTREEIESYNAK